MSIRKNKKLQQEQVIHQKDQTFLQSVGITRTVERPREESDIQLREDRIGRYFRKYLNKFVFVEFSEEFIAQSKAGDLLKGVPVPLRKKEVKDFAGGKGINFLVLAENMAWVMGCDPHFKHTKDYCAILHKLYNKKLTEGMLKEGRDAAEQGEMDNACIHFRAALCMQFDYMHAMYSYARACRVMYENSRNEEYVGRFKAESLEWFELLTETHPRFAMGYYYLGYSYLNMGLYGKAQLAWKSFLRFTKNNKDRREINKRLQQIADPGGVPDGVGAGAGYQQNPVRTGAAKAEAGVHSSGSVQENIVKGLPGPPQHGAEGLRIDFLHRPVHRGCEKPKGGVPGMPGGILQAVGPFRNIQERKRGHVA